MAKVEIEDTELAQLRRQIAKLEAESEQRKDYDAIKGERDTYKTRLGELNAGREKSAFEALGVTSEKAQRFLRMEFEALPAEGKPADVTAWLEGIKAAPDKIPADLASFIKMPAAGAPSQAPSAPSAPVPNANTGAAPPPTGAPKWSAEAISQMSPEEYAARRAEILSSSPTLQAMTRGLPGLDSPAAPAASPAR